MLISNFDYPIKSEFAEKPKKTPAIFIGMIPNKLSFNKFSIKLLDQHHPPEQDGFNSKIWKMLVIICI